MTNDEAPTQRARAPADGAASRAGFAAGQRVFARYVLEAQIGRGGMGVVWRAHDEKLDRSVALKFLPPDVAADAEAVRDLKLETRRCLDLTHVNIVRVYDFIEEDTSAAIAMEYVEGESLAKIKANAPGGCLAATDLIPLVAQLCAALRYAHLVAKVAHHDLKPANVLVTRDGVLKVTDFGIARSLAETHTRLTGKIGTSGTSGTLLYMSPQQLSGEKPTAADDIYALGALLYELLTGKPPFFRGDPLSLRQQVFEKAPAPLEAHRRDVGATGPDIPPAWSETILACLAKKPGDRPATADDVATRLGVALEPMPTSGLAYASTAARTRHSAPETAPPPRRSLVPWLLGAGALVIGLTAAVIYLGVQVPEQVRLEAEQERAQQAERLANAKRVRQAEEQRREAENKRKAAEELALAERQKEEAARAQMAKDQQAYSAIMERISVLTDTSPPAQINEVQRAVQNYLKTAPDPYRAPVDKAWNDRQTAWRLLAAAKRPGSLVVETDPSGATVSLYPSNKHKTSPALFEDVKPGEVSLRIEKEGYEPKDVPFVMKPGVTNRLDPVKLVAIYGNLAITSDPPDVYVLLEGNGRRLEGRTPFNPTGLPPGDYKVTYQRRGWLPQVKPVTIERGKEAKLAANLKGADIELHSTPAGAQIVVDRLSIGAAPVKLLGIEPRTYQLTATLDGYEVLNRKLVVTRSDTVTLALTEKALPHALRRIAGARWHYDSFTTAADLTFTAQGKIAGTHHSGLGGQVRDVGTADAFNVNTSTFTARFTGQGKPFYAGNVQIKIIDDDHLAVSWTAGGSAERWVFERDKGKK